MIKGSAQRSELETLKRLYRKRRSAIRERLSEFSSVPASEYFYELAYCLLTPQSSAVHADRAVETLRSHLFSEQGGNPEQLLRNPAHYIRFHRTKARHLLLARAGFPAVLQALSNGRPAGEVREWLVKNVKGLGYKEATHFLRNIGKNNGLAILDRHILRNLKRYGSIRSVPKALTRRKYLAIEQRFKAFSQQIGIPPDELDLLLWSMETGEIRK
jgi:N-glycosylase/DNA lyase